MKVVDVPLEELEQALTERGRRTWFPPLSHWELLVEQHSPEARRLIAATLTGLNATAERKAKG